MNITKPLLATVIILALVAAAGAWKLTSDLNFDASENVQPLNPGDANE